MALKWARDRGLVGKNGLGWGRGRAVVWLFRVSARDRTHIRARASQVLCHWAAALVQEEVVSSGKEKTRQRAAHEVGPGQPWPRRPPTGLCGVTTCNGVGYGSRLRSCLEGAERKKSACAS